MPSISSALFLVFVFYEITALRLRANQLQGWRQLFSKWSQCPEGTPVHHGIRIPSYPVIHSRSPNCSETIFIVYNKPDTECLSRANSCAPINWAQGTSVLGGETGSVVQGKYYRRYLPHVDPYFRQPSMLEVTIIWGRECMS